MGDDIREMESIDTLAAYHKAKFDINKVERKKTVYSQLMRYAALLAIPLLMTSLVLGYLYFAGAEEEVKYAEITAATGSVIRYELPDGSVVWLNAGTTLRYPTVFKKDNRSVELKGEAYFEIQADQERPFLCKYPEWIECLCLWYKIQCKRL